MFRHESSHEINACVYVRVAAKFIWNAVAIDPAAGRGFSNAIDPAGRHVMHIYAYVRTRALDRPSTCSYICMYRDHNQCATTCM